MMDALNFTSKVQIIDQKSCEQSEIRTRYAKVYWEKNQRKGETLLEAEKLMRSADYFASMMVDLAMPMQ